MNHYTPIPTEPIAGADEILKCEAQEEIQCEGTVPILDCDDDKLPCFDCGCEGGCGSCPDFPDDCYPHYKENCICCQGPKGDKGDQGEKGDQGIQGIQGVQGPQGLTGATGAKGDQGERGVQGETGAMGPQGAQGIQGPKGDQGLQGVKGDKGDTGLQGIQGLQGAKGDQGLQGVKGDKGDTGLQGIQGLQGAKGDQGVQGVKGDKGDTGATGAQGIQGVKGDKGDTGLQGLQGVQGVKGDTGATGPQGPTGATGPQGPTGPKGDPGSSCGIVGPTGAQGPAGEKGDTGAQGEAGKMGGVLCPCELLFGKVVSFLLENGFPFDVTVDAPFALTLTSDETTPAQMYNTWGVEFDGEIVVPLCKMETVQLSFATEQEKDTFVNLISVVLSQTLSCCHSCSSCEVCDDLLDVDQYLSIIDMSATCNYEYYLEASCRCDDTTCDTLAKRIDLCNYVNTTGEKLRGIVERKADEGKALSLIATQKEALFPDAPTKTIEGTGLSSVLVSFEDGGTYRVALVCLNDATVLGFE